MIQADSVHSTPPINASADTTLERPAPDAGALCYKTPVTPEEAFQAIGRLRKEARNEIDRMIRFLDKTDDYVSRELEEAVDDLPCDTDDLEVGEGDDEPSLGTHQLWSGAVSYLPSTSLGEIDVESNRAKMTSPRSAGQPKWPARAAQIRT